jgi:hypothetical protein
LRDFLISITTWRRERKRILEWLRDEWRLYADVKFDDQRSKHDAHMADTALEPDGWWRNQVLQYVHRAQVLGVDTEAGRQAAVKGLAAYHGMCESMVRVYGNPPKPGVPSGEIVS